MNKCVKCGREFEGQFCPNCGTRYEAEKICPDCGATLEGGVNFCNHCGHRFETYENVNSQQNNRKMSFEFGVKFYKTVGNILKWSPCALFLLFAVLNFVFMSISAYSAFGLDMGSIYKITDADYKFTATILIVVCSLSAFYALVYPLLLGKCAKVAHIIAFALYVLVLAVSCAMHIQIKKGDWTVEASTKLLIAFSLVFGVLSAFSLLTDFLLSKRSFKYLQAKTAPKDNSQPTFFAKVAYNVKSWYNYHKKAANGAIIAVCSLAVVCVLVFAVIVPLATNIFSANKLSKINIGDSKEQVVSIIGEPYGGNTEANVWTYYGDEFVDLMKQQDDINKQMENLSDFNQLGQLMEQQAKLDEKINSTTGKYIAVTFDSNQQVTSVMYDAAYNKLTQYQPKEVKKTTLGDENTVNSSDILNGAVRVKTSYTDGSYKLTTLQSINEISFSKADAESNERTPIISWNDSYGTYNKEVTIIYNHKDIKSTNWYAKQPNGLVYFLGSCVGYKGDITGELEIKDGTLSIESYAFENCTGATKFIIPNSVTSIGENAFYKCSNLTEITVPDSVKYIGHAAFADCDNLQYISLPFLGYSLSSTEHFGIVFWANYPDEQSRQVPTTLKTVVITGGNTVAEKAFYGCSHIEKIVLPDSITSIGNEAFRYCSNLTDINIPKNVMDIGSSTFIDCDNLENLYLDSKNNNFSLINGVLYTNDKSKILFATKTANGFVDIYENTSVINTSILNAKHISGINVSANHPTLSSVDGVLYNKEKTILLWAPKTLTGKFVVSDTVTAIDSCAFQNCSDLTDIIIPEGVTEIGYDVFDNCSSLTHLSLPNSITFIGSDILSSCPKLQYLEDDGQKYLGNDTNQYLVLVSGVWSINENTVIIGISAFSQYCRISHLTVPDSVICIGFNAFYNAPFEDVVIGNGVRFIDDDAFDNCYNLSSITIGKNVEYIGAHCFSDCHNLTNIVFDGSLEQWNAIEKSEYWNIDLRATKVICSDGEVTL